MDHTETAPALFCAAEMKQIGEIQRRSFDVSSLSGPLEIHEPPHFRAIKTSQFLRRNPSARIQRADCCCIPSAFHYTSALIADQNGGIVSPLARAQRRRSFMPGFFLDD